MWPALTPAWAPDRNQGLWCLAGVGHCLKHWSERRGLGSCFRGVLLGHFLIRKQKFQSLSWNSALWAVKTIVRAVKPMGITPTITGRQLTGSDGLGLLPCAVVSRRAEDLPHLCSLPAGYWTLEKQRLWLERFIPPRPPFCGHTCMHAQARTNTQTHIHTCTRTCLHSSGVPSLFCFGDR